MTHHLSDLYRWWLSLPDVVWVVLLAVCVGGYLLTSWVVDRKHPR